MGSITRAALIVLVLTGTVVTAQDVTESALKATFIYNLMKFTTWPDARPTSTPWVVCVLGDAAVGEALTSAVEGRALNDRRISVLKITPGQPVGGCHILYVSGMAATEASQFLAGVVNLPVLTISDLKGFTDVGGIARCYFEYGQLRFIVRRASLGRAKLQMSSRVLVMAKLE